MYTHTHPRRVREGGCRKCPWGAVVRSVRAAERVVSAIEHWVAAVSAAAAAFERRWTRAALVRVDAGLAKRLFAQIQDFDRALVTGEVEDVERQGAATVRGYDVCRRAMEGSAEPDDAYVLGFDEQTGVRVAIGHQRAAAERVAELHGASVVWMSADEVAGLLAGVEAFKTAAAVKRLWPGSVIERYPDEPAKGDA